MRRPSRSFGKLITARPARFSYGARRGERPRDSARNTFRPITRTSTSACRFVRRDIAWSTLLARGCGTTEAEVQNQHSGRSCSCINGSAFDSAGSTSSRNSSRRTRSPSQRSDARRSALADVPVDCWSSTIDCQRRRVVPPAGCRMRSASSLKPDMRWASGHHKALMRPSGSWASAGFEVIAGALEAHLRDPCVLYDIVVIPRRHHFERYAALVRECQPQSVLVYDAASGSHVVDARSTLADNQGSRTHALETSLRVRADFVTCASQAEEALFRATKGAAPIVFVPSRTQPMDRASARAWVHALTRAQSARSPTDSSAIRTGDARAVLLAICAILSGNRATDFAHHARCQLERSLARFVTSSLVL